MRTLAANGNTIAVNLVCVSAKILTYQQLDHGILPDHTVIRELNQVDTSLELFAAGVAGTPDYLTH